MTRKPRGLASRILALAALCAAVWLQGCGESGGGAVHETMPRKTDASSKWVFFLEGHGADGEAMAVAEAIAARGYQVVFQDRPEDTDPDFFAVKIKEDVRLLLARSVPPGHVAIVGIGDGGRITLITAALLQTPGMAFVAAKACPRDGPGKDLLSRITFLQAQTMRGRVLSLTAGEGTCQAVFEKAKGAEAWEVEMPDARFGAGDASWIDEAVRWIEGE